MLLKVKLLSINLISAILLLTVLCLGAQNLEDRYQIKLIGANTAPLPAGFIVGVSIVLGVISGGSLAALLAPDKETDQ